MAAKKINTYIKISVYIINLYFFSTRCKIFKSVKKKKSVLCQNFGHSSLGSLVKKVSKCLVKKIVNFHFSLVTTLEWKKTPNFDEKSCFVVFFHEWNEWKNPQFNFLSQNLSLERNFFKWDGKVTKIWHLLFHRIWKIK